MARGHDTYSRLVAWLKILLPTLALVVLGTVFLITSDDGFEAGFSFSEADIETLEAGSFLGEPRIDGVTDQGDTVHLSAFRIAPQDQAQNLILVTAVSGEIRYVSGGWAKIRADEAVMNLQDQTITFAAGGTVETSDGNISLVSSLVVELETGGMQGSMIIADGPLGRVSADQFKIEATSGENRVLWFEKNVMMHYDLSEEG